MRYWICCVCLVILACGSAISTAVAGTVVSVRDFGAKGDARTDDTAAIQAAFTASGKGGVGGSGSAVVFPPGRYLISKTINAHAAEVSGQGYPTIFTNDKEVDLMSSRAWQITIRGLQFRGGRDHLVLGNNNINESFYVVTDCRFRDASGAAVRFRDKSWSTFSLVEKCAFRECMQTLIAATDQTVLRDCWITTHREMRNKATIVNTRGFLTCENIVGVPLGNGGDQRWIDNYGSVICKQFRFGGEFGGFTPVVNFAKRAEQLFGPLIILADCNYIGAVGNAQRPCAIYLEEIPNGIVVRNSNLGGIPPVIVDKKIDLKTYFDGVRPGMLRFDITGNIGEFADSVPQELLDAPAKLKATAAHKDQLSPAETAAALAKAVEAAAKVPSAPAGVMKHKVKDPGHRQQTEPGKYVDITPQTHRWDLEDRMDGTNQANSVHLALAAAGDDVVVIRRTPGDKTWPHVLVRDIEVDLDRTPYISWRIKDNGLEAPGYAVRVVDAETRKAVILTEQHWGPFFDYRAYDLRKALGYEGGVHKVEVKFYFLGINFRGPSQPFRAEKGDYWVLDFLRLEAP